MYSLKGLSTESSLSHRVDIILRMEDPEDVMDALVDRWVDCPEFRAPVVLDLPTGAVKLTLGPDLTLVGWNKAKLGSMLRGLLAQQRDSIKQREEAII